MAIEIRMGDQLVVIPVIAQHMKANIRLGLMKAGEILQRQMIKNLSGKRTHGNPYPGWVSSTLRTSVIAQMQPGDAAIAVGPGGAAKSYAAIHEFGGTITQTVKETRRIKIADQWVTLAAGRVLVSRIPKRSYAWPAAMQKTNEIVEAISKAVMKV